jgi:hypothetical protein
LANTEVLHDKINKLSSRVRELEDALATSHAMFTTDPHPLLHEDLLLIKNPLELEPHQDGQGTQTREKEEEPIDAFQSLYVLLMHLPCPHNGSLHIIKIH